MIDIQITLETENLPYKTSLSKMNYRIKVIFINCYLATIYYYPICIIINIINFQFLLRLIYQSISGANNQN